MAGRVHPRTAPRRAIEDQQSGTRRVALRMLAEKRPDESTHELLRARAVEDQEGGTRGVALRELAEKWPDESTHELLRARPSKIRRAVPAVSRCGCWRRNGRTSPPTNYSAPRRRRSGGRYPRCRVAGVGGEMAGRVHPRTTPRRAVEDREGDIRVTALRELAEKWPDESTHELLRACAVEDQEGDTRGVALRVLAEKWPDESTRELLRARAVEDQDILACGAACSVLGAMHSEFGRLLPTKDLDGVGPYLDPRMAVPRDHIEKAASRTGIASGDIDAQLASLSKHLGWDVTRGARPSPSE